MQHSVTKLYRCKVAVKIMAEFVDGGGPNHESCNESEGEFVDEQL